MDFGVLMGFDASSVSPSDPHSNQKLYGSAVCNTVTHQDDDDDDYRRKKMIKTSDDLSAIHHTSSLMRSNGGNISDSQQMLCFSSPNSLPYYYGSYARNTASGYGYGIKGPFTPSQWMELEHQALIYKYITANAPVPSNLLIPIRKAIESAAISCFPASHLTPNSLRWGGFHLGFSNTDPEPGRCRRTDGKKWRCSRDAVIDQKYCERHINRGRHRSRKPVEPQNGHSSSRPPPTTTTSKAVPPSSSTSPALVSGGNSSNTLSLDNLQPLVPPSLTRSTCMNNEFGLVSSNSLLNPLHKTYEETKSENSLRQFMDDWPKNRSTDRTELSISIPVPSSPTNEKLIPLSPLRLSHENIEMEMNQKNWVPISWENAIGGPLGEVLNNSAGSGSGSALNLMTEGWDSCPSIASSPTGVLQNSTFRSFSSSPTIVSFTQI